MRALTFFRAMAWFGVVVTFWSLNVRWGIEEAAGKGPPAPVHRMVVGAALLSLIAAFVLSISGRKGRAPAWWARGVAAASSLGMLLIAWSLYGKAQGAQIYMLQGTGFPWLLAGSGMIMSAVIGSLGLASPSPDPKKGASGSSTKGRKRKRR